MSEQPSQPSKPTVIDPTEHGDVEWQQPPAVQDPGPCDDDPPAPFEESDETTGDDESTDAGDPDADPAPAEDDSEVATPGGEGQ